MPTTGTSTLVPPPGEDSTSYERHTDALQAPDVRNSELIGDLMSTSFALRRRFIIDEPLGISDLLKSFLSCNNGIVWMHMIGQIMMWAVLQLCKEMSGITGLEDLCGVARERWRTYLPKILSQSKIEAPDNAILSKLSQTTDLKVKVEKN